MSMQLCMHLYRKHFQNGRKVTALSSRPKAPINKQTNIFKIFMWHSKYELINRKQQIIEDICLFAVCRLIVDCFYSLLGLWSRMPCNLNGECEWNKNEMQTSRCITFGAQLSPCCVLKLSCHCLCMVVRSYFVTPWWCRVPSPAGADRLGRIALTLRYSNSKGALVFTVHQVAWVPPPEPLAKLSVVVYNSVGVAA